MLMNEPGRTETLNLSVMSVTDAIDGSDNDFNGGRSKTIDVTTEAAALSGVWLMVRAWRHTCHNCALTVVHVHPSAQGPASSHL